MNESPTGQTVLVTGGAGFIGSHLVDALVEENDVRVLDNFSSGQRDNLRDEVTVFEGDIRDDDLLARAISGADLVYHTAALVSVAASVENPLRSHSTNASATVSLLEHARAEDARVVLSSSAAIYGQPEAVPIDESHPKSPESPYGADKLALDTYARLYHDLYGLETVALRYFNVYGPRQTAGDYSGVISIFLDQATTDQPITVEGDGGQTRDFVHVRDVVQANLAAGTTDAVGQAYNVGTGDTISINDLAEAIRDAADSSSEITHVDARPGDVRDSRADISRIRDALGFDPTVTLSEGLSSLCE
ncbi:UDP-glucose 4-epimerase [Haloprofundus marisrubri]|uniref:UDP-glucose 4-epimerase n=1 Tax=Haloprofundus marisrubri TaxID=1514971 RepID=A0A0W1R2Y9_9EURY|nr:NAD-dependent epimerase/dehydratase family protein [Haloprofundus marisrubri]KTG07808.1 UDP-glucose 4-epimerase [Haloprofundus marisrubri]